MNCLSVFVIIVEFMCLCSHAIKAVQPFLFFELGRFVLSISSVSPHFRKTRLSLNRCYCIIPIGDRCCLWLYQSCIRSFSVSLKFCRVIQTSRLGACQRNSQMLSPISISIGPILPVKSVNDTRYININKPIKFEFRKCSISSSFAAIHWLTKSGKSRLLTWIQRTNYLNMKQYDQLQWRNSSMNYSVY